MRKVCSGLALISISNALTTTRSASEIDVAGPGRLREIGLVKLWKWEPENLPHVVRSICTAVAEAALFWRLRLPGPELRPGSRNKARVNCTVVAGVSPVIPGFCRRHGCRYRRFVSRRGQRTRV